jgi:hypothetical protein
MAYSNVRILNNTPYEVTGEVHYMSCSDDSYNVAPGQEWEASSRGACLVTKIDGQVLTPQGHFEARPYESSGTSYSLFTVIPIPGGAYEIIRRASGAEDEPPEDYEEPTSDQK